LHWAWPEKQQMVILYGTICGRRENVCHKLNYLVSSLVFTVVRV
jgi:hypothetical protein